MFNLEIYVISLRHRLDRIASCREELANLEINHALVKYIPALLTPRNGIIGTATSHAYALSRFLYESDGEYCLVLEDDFQIKEKISFLQSLQQPLTVDSNWDVLLLASNGAVPITITEFPGVYRVIEAQTCFGYMVKRTYAPTLVKEFFDSSALISTIYPSFQGREANNFYAPDAMWKHLQLRDIFYAYLPQLITRRESFPDTENRVIL
jgi:hypothetical protein